MSAAAISSSAGDDSFAYITALPGDEKNEVNNQAKYEKQVMKVNYEDSKNLKENEIISKKYEENFVNVWVCMDCDNEKEIIEHEKNCNKTESTNIKITYYRCGRRGHIRPNCCAKTHINGNYLT